MRKKLLAIFNKLNLKDYSSYFSLLFIYTKINLKSQLAYKKAFFLQVFGMILNDLGFLILWALLFESFEESFKAKGVEFSAIALIWGFSASSFGLMHALFAGFRDLPRIIIEGKLDNYLLYPKNTLFLSGASFSDASAWGDLIYGYILYFIFLPKSITGFFLFTYFIIMAAMFFASILIMFSSLTFFIGNSEQIKETVFNAIVSFSTYPEKIYSNPFRIILYTFIPVGFGIYLPVRVITKFNLLLFIVATIVPTLLLLLSVFLFYRGLKKYESSNLIIMQG